MLTRNTNDCNSSCCMLQEVCAEVWKTLFDALQSDQVLKPQD